MPLTSRIERNALYASAAVTCVGAKMLALMLRILPGRMKR